MRSGCRSFRKSWDLWAIEEEAAVEEEMVEDEEEKKGGRMLGCGDQVEGGGEA